MTTMQVVPRSWAAIYVAADMIHLTGAKRPVDLFASIDFGPEHTHLDKLNNAFETGWLQQAGDLVELTDLSRRHFDKKRPPAPKYVGQEAPPAYRPNVFASTLNRRHIPNRHGLRPANDAAPAWSVRETLSIKTIGGGDAA